MTHKPEFAQFSIEVEGDNGRIRFSIPPRKQWWLLLLALLYISLILIVGGPLHLTILRHHLTEWSNISQSPSFFWLTLGGFLLWLAVVLLVLYAILWQLTGRYILEIGDKVVKVGRRVMGVDFLRSYDATSLRRIRIGPHIGIGRDGLSLIPIKQQAANAKLFGTGRYTLQLDYGLKAFFVMNMRLEDGKVPIIKQAIHHYFPDL